MHFDPGVFLLNISDHTLPNERKQPLPNQCRNDTFNNISGKRLNAAGKEHWPNRDGIAVVKTVHEIKIGRSEHVQNRDSGKTCQQHTLETRVFTFVCDRTGDP